MDYSFRIAIADDNATFRHQLQVMLKTLGHQVVLAAETGRELVDQCLLASPDVIISDIRMPDMDGLEAASLIHLESNIPIILISSDCDRDLILRAEQNHVLKYLVKPLVQSNLETALALLPPPKRTSVQTDADELRGKENDGRANDAPDGDGAGGQAGIVRRIETVAIPRSPVDTGRIPRSAAGIGEN